MKNHDIFIFNFGTSLLKPNYFKHQHFYFNNILAANLMAKACNCATELQTVTTIGAAKSVAWKWACNLLVF